MKILVIEDDGETASYLVKGLYESGYTVDCAGNGRDGLYLEYFDAQCGSHGQADDVAGTRLGLSFRLANARK